jgi:hypothetical protein
MCNILGSFRNPNLLIYLEGKLLQAFWPCKDIRRNKGTDTDPRFKILATHNIFKVLVRVYDKK